MGPGSYFGRVGGLAVALGVGTAIAMGNGVAAADTTDSSPSPSTDTSSINTSTTGTASVDPFDDARRGRVTDPRRRQNHDDVGTDAGNRGSPGR